MSGNKASLNTLKEQLKGMGENAFTIPNILSIIRIILIPVFVLLFQSGKYLPAVM